MSGISFIWLTISSKVFVDFLDAGRLLLYNTDNGDMFCSTDKRLHEVVSRIYSPENLGVIPYESSMSQVVGESVRKGFLVVLKKTTSVKPINLLPILSLQKDLECSASNQNSDGKYSLLGNKLYYLSGLYISLDNCTVTDDAMACFRNKACLQYPCACYGKRYEYLSLETLQRLLSQASRSSDAVVDLVCSHKYFAANGLQTFVNLLIDYSFKYRIHIYAEDYVKVCGHDLQALSECCQFHVYVDRFTPLKFIKCVVSQKQKNVICRLLYDFSDMDLNIPAVCLPVWTGDNERLFKEKVWISLDGLRKEPRNMSYLFRNQKMNSNFFGILDVSCAGDVSPHGTSFVLGNIYRKFSLLDAVAAEFKENHSWRICRTDLSNCQPCPLRFVCPPVSVFELQNSGNRMCNIKIADND